jgi:thymidine kinase
MGNSVISTLTESMNSGYLHLYIGPMYAGKTTKLIETYEECISNDENAIVLTHSAEIRYSIDKLSTHDQKNISCFKCDTIKSFISEHNDTIQKCHIILIDEGQFFTDLMEVLYLVNTLNKHVFVFGLDGDFKRNKFGQILDLIPHCDVVEKLTAVCNECNKTAIFSYRTNESCEQMLIGSHDVYQPLCRVCYNSKQNS